MVKAQPPRTALISTTNAISYTDKQDNQISQVQEFNHMQHHQLLQSNQLTLAQAAKWNIQSQP